MSNHSQMMPTSPRDGGSDGGTQSPKISSNWRRCDGHHPKSWIFVAGICLPRDPQARVWKVNPKFGVSEPPNFVS